MCGTASSHRGFFTCFDFHEHMYLARCNLTWLCNRDEQQTSEVQSVQQNKEHLDSIFLVCRSSLFTINLAQGSSSKIPLIRMLLSSCWRRTSQLS